MHSNIELNSSSSVGLSKSRKHLIAEVISLHVSLEQLLDVFVHEKKVIVSGNKTFHNKATSLKDSALKDIILKFNTIRNTCAHERMDKKAKISEIIAQCKDFLTDLKKVHEDKFNIAESTGTSPLQSAITVIFDELASTYGCTTPRIGELDGFYYPGQKTLDDEIYEIIGIRL
ncbi:hypothetical protein [Aeromonas caviae]|uniref:hypothetical protein n=1 Tax=Aeromonas caviae TaxID=648 RepID=UPI002B4A3F99|nr:hypothetical protein [Aeromonas caviae]